MVDWLPQDLPSKGQRYLAIAEAMARDIRDGKLRPGDQLPTHRELAYKLGVSVSTVSKAYAEATRRQFISSEVGRGTYVLLQARSDRSRQVLALEDPGLIDLGYNCPVLDSKHTGALAKALTAVAKGDRFARLLAYERPYLGLEEHRAAGAAWVRRQGVETSPDNIVVVGGAQHGGSVTLASVCRPGDVVLTEDLTDPGMKFLCANLQLSLRGVETDEQGLLPDAVEAACRGTRIKALFCMPNHQSPTLSVMPPKRRAEIAAIAARYDFTIIENDVYGGYLESPPAALASFAPDRTYYYTSLSKLMAPGLRIGYVAAPPGRAMDLVAGLGSTSWMTSHLSAEVASLWINDGTAEKLASWQRKEMARRHALVKQILIGCRYTALPTSLHVWMPVPSPWRADNFTKQARLRGVVVTPGEVFVVGHNSAPQSIRISLGGATASRVELEKGLHILLEVLNGRVEPALLVM